MISEALSEAPQAIAEMPQYKCLKTVWALKIKSLEASAAPSTDHITFGGAWMTPVESGYGSMLLEKDFMQKHKPQVGGYYVVYKDGYASYSPAKAFEEGYERV